MRPHEYAALFSASLEAFDATRPRSEQKIPGVSSVGVCHEQFRFLLSGETGENKASMKALVGTWAHAGITEARRAFNPALLHDVELEITLPSGVQLLGHADEIDRAEPSVCDFKSADGLSIARRTGSDDQQRFQRHLYALGAIQAGLVPEEGLTVRNIWIDRSGRTDEVHVEQEPFSRDVIIAADAWISDSLYALQHGEPAQRDKDRTWCEQCCPFFLPCRGEDTIDATPLTDPLYEVAARTYVEGKATEKAAAVEAEDARRLLEGVSGKAGPFLIRWTHVNPVDKAPYDRLLIRTVGDAA